MWFNNFDSTLDACLGQARTLAVCRRFVVAIAMLSIGVPENTLNFTLRERGDENEKCFSRSPCLDECDDGFLRLHDFYLHAAGLYLRQ